MGEQKKIKILRIINRFNIGGPTYNATFLTKFMSDEFETLLIGGLPEENEANSLHILEEYDVEPLLVPEMKREPNLKSDRLALKKIKTIIQEFQPDIVHTHASKAGAIGRKAAFSCNVPVVVHTFHGHVFHSYFGKVKTTLFKNIERYLAKKSSGIIAISNLQKKELCEEHKITSAKKMEVIPLGFDLKKFQDNYTEKRKATRLKYEITDDCIALCIIGRLAPVKDHFFFLDVIEELSKKTERKIKIFIVGDGELKSEIENRVNTLQHKQETLTLRLFEHAKPTIASLPGPAVGAGMCIALACDIRVGAESAFISVKGYAVSTIINFLAYVSIKFFSGTSIVFKLYSDHKG